MRVSKLAVDSSVLLALLAASPALGQSRTHELKGDFAFTDTTTCAFGGVGGFLTAATVNGVISFFGDGTGTLSARNVGLGSTGLPNFADLTAPITYSVAADRSFAFDQGPTTVNNTSLTVPPTTSQTLVSDIPTLMGHLSSDGKSITFGSFSPGVETLTRVQPQPEVTSQRICLRSRTAIRIGSVPGSSGNGDD